MTAIGSNELRQVTADVFHHVLGLDIVDVEPSHVGADAVAARISITGSWRGTLILRAGPVLARRLAARMFAQRAGTLTDEDVRDGFGELCNMIAGNVKGLLDGESRLGLAVVTHWQPPADPRNAPPLVALHLEVRDTPFQVFLIGAAAPQLIGAGE